jgi:hypothetical protein
MLMAARSAPDKETPAMITENGIEFHNVAELVPFDHPRGKALYRYPRETIEVLSTLGHHAAACSDGVELRFVTGAHWISLTLSARSNYPFSPGAKVRVYRGDFLVEETDIPDGATKTLKLMEPAGLATLSDEAFAGCRFSRDLWRVQFNSATVIFHDLDTVGEPLRAPNPEEKPQQRWLAYGSSITNSTPGYVAHAARHLGVDVYNKGLSGSCWCEPETASFLAGCEDWDFATLELGLNMRGAFDSDEFEKRARNVVSTLRKAAPDKPIALITIFPNAANYLKEPTDATAKDQSFSEILRKIHQDADDPNLHLIEGADVLTSFAGLSADLIHPSTDGHQLMGANLAKYLRELLNG